jgi:hypothetical protein
MATKIKEIKDQTCCCATLNNFQTVDSSKVTVSFSEIEISKLIEFENNMILVLKSKLWWVNFFEWIGRDLNPFGFKSNHFCDLKNQFFAILTQILCLRGLPREGSNPAALVPEWVQASFSEE